MSNSGKNQRFFVPCDLEICHGCAANRAGHCRSVDWAGGGGWRTRPPVCSNQSPWGVVAMPHWVHHRARPREGTQQLPQLGWAAAPVFCHPRARPREGSRQLPRLSWAAGLMFCHCRTRPGEGSQQLPKLGWAAAPVLCYPRDLPREGTQQLPQPGWAAACVRPLQSPPRDEGRPLSQPGWVAAPVSCHCRACPRDEDWLLPQPCWAAAPVSCSCRVWLKDEDQLLPQPGWVAARVLPLHSPPQKCRPTAPPACLGGSSNVLWSPPQRQRPTTRRLLPQIGKLDWNKGLSPSSPVSLWQHLQWRRGGNLLWRGRPPSRCWPRFSPLKTCQEGAVMSSHAGAPAGQDHRLQVCARWLPSTTQPQEDPIPRCSEPRGPAALLLPGAMLEVLEPFLDRITKLESDNSKYHRLLWENRDTLRGNKKAMEDLTKSLGKGIKCTTTVDDGPSRKWKK